MAERRMFANRKYIMTYLSDELYQKAVLEIRQKPISIDEKIALLIEFRRLVRES